MHETFGVAVNEAMNFGLPVVVSDRVGAGRDLVREGENGFVTAADDLEDLTNRLGDLVDDEGLRDRFGRESLSIISKWDYEAAHRGVVAAIAEAVGSERWGTLEVN
jgi:glycosyltransferase involved in cell wall biosynthesis